MQVIEMDDGLRQKVTTAVAETPLFHGLNEEQVGQIVTHAELVKFEDGERALEQGASCEDFYLMISGEALVQRTGDGGGEPVEVGRVTAPNTVGEMGLLLESPRSASVIASGEVVAVRFEKAAFQAMYQKIPYFGLVISRALALRLSQVNRRINLPQSTETGRPTPDVLRLLPTPFLQRHRVLPLQMQGNVLMLGCIDDPGPTALGAARQLLPSIDLRPVRIEAGLFDEVMSSRAGLDAWAPAGEDDAELAAPDEDETGRSPKLDELLHRMVAEGASDLHLAAGHRPFWRVDSDMRALEDASPLGKNDVWTLLEPTMAERARDEFAEQNDADFAYAVPGLARFRVNIFRDHRGVNAALRLIPDKILSFEQLGLPKAVGKFCTLPKGLVLVTGPTGSGKSSTLAAMLDAINATRAGHVITLEDPIEFVHESQSCLVNQREVGNHARSFDRALRACLREDPDIILVGEMRDFETVSLVIEAASTGHLVFATLHTTTAALTVDRIVGFFPPEEQPQIQSRLADSLKGVVAQCLCRKIGGGRVAALEILVSNPAVTNLIREGKTNQLENTMQTGAKQGNILLNESLERLIRSRKISREEGLSHALDKTDLVRRLQPPSVEPPEKKS